MNSILFLFLFLILKSRIRLTFRMCTSFAHLEDKTSPWSIINSWSTVRLERDFARGLHNIFRKYCININTCNITKDYLESKNCWLILSKLSKLAFYLVMKYSGRQAQFPSEIALYLPPFIFRQLWQATSSLVIKHFPTRWCCTTMFNFGENINWGDMLPSF